MVCCFRPLSPQRLSNIGFVFTAARRNIFVVLNELDRVVFTRIGTYYIINHVFLTKQKKKKQYMRSERTRNDG